MLVAKSVRSCTAATRDKLAKESETAVSVVEWILVTMESVTALWVAEWVLVTVKPEAAL